MDRVARTHLWLILFVTTADSTEATINTQKPKTRNQRPHSAFIIQHLGRSPDGNHIIFSVARGAKFALYQKVSRGAGSDEVLLQTKNNSFVDDWLRMEDGREFILYESEEQIARFGLHILPLFGDRRARLRVSEETLVPLLLRDDY